MPSYFQARDKLYKRSFDEADKPTDDLTPSLAFPLAPEGELSPEAEARMNAFANEGEDKVTIGHPNFEFSKYNQQFSDADDPEAAARRYEKINAILNKGQK